MKRSLLLMLIFLTGCGAPASKPSAGASSASSNDSETEMPRIALIMKSLANDFFSTMEAGAMAHQGEHADRYELISNGIKDESDLGRQVAIVDEMVAAGVDAIVIAPADSKALVPALRKAMNAGVVVVNIDNRLDAEVLQKEGVAIPFVGPDNRAGAKMVGDVFGGQANQGRQGRRARRKDHRVQRCPASTGV